jgi:NitT/TauT family transport system substrate-binding protein
MLLEGRFLATAFAGAAMTAWAGMAEAQESLSVRLDFSPWGLHAGFHLAQGQRLVRVRPRSWSTSRTGRGSATRSSSSMRARWISARSSSAFWWPPGSRVGDHLLRTACSAGPTSASWSTGIRDRGHRRSRGQDGRRLRRQPWAGYIDQYLAAGGKSPVDGRGAVRVPRHLWVHLYGRPAADGLMSTVARPSGGRGGAGRRNA